MSKMIKRIFNFGLKEYKNHKKVVHQTGILFFSQIFIILSGIASKGFQTRALGSADYGLYAFFGTITGFTVLFFRFGLFSSIRVLLANNDDKKKEKELFGVGFLVALFVGLTYALFIFGISFFIDTAFKVEFGTMLRLVSPFCFVLPFQFLIPALAIGSNKIENSALYNIFSKLLFVIPLIVLFFYNRLTVITIILLHLGAIIITIVYILKRFKPLFNNIKKRLREIWEKNKDYGRKVYLGQIVTQATYKTDQLFISYFVNTLWVGFYSLTVALTSPMVMLSSALGQSLFKGFAKERKIPKKVIMYNFLWLLGCVVGLLLIGKPIIIILFSQEFLPATTLIIPLAIAGFFQGMYQPYIQFLGAHQQGRYQRNAALFCSICSMGTNILLIPPFGAFGAAIASAISMLFTFLLNIFYYEKTMNLLKVGV